MKNKTLFLEKTFIFFWKITLQLLKIRENVESQIPAFLNNALHFSSTVLVFRCLFDPIVEKCQLNKTSNQTYNVMSKFQ